MVLSTLLFYASQQVGTTYGEFNSIKEDFTGIQACEIFPEKIESLLSDLNAHLDRASFYKNSLQMVSVTYDTYEATWSAWTSENLTVTASTYGEGGFGGPAGMEQETAAADVSGQIAELSKQLENLQLIYDGNRSAWDQLSAEMSASSAITLELLQLIQQSQPNCVEIRQASLFGSISDRVNQPQFLSGALRDSLGDILAYLRKIYDAGLELDRLPYLSTNRIEGIYVFEGYAANGDPVSQELLAYYNSLQQSMSSTMTDLSSDILKLEEFQATLLEAAELRRLAELERAKQLETEQAKQLEQEQQELEQEPKQEEEQHEDTDLGHGETPPGVDEPHQDTESGSEPVDAPINADPNQTGTGVDANDV